MKPVIQEEFTGCGIASVAAIAKVTYSKAKKAANQMGIFSDDRMLWSDTEYVRQLSCRFGVKLGQHEMPFKEWSKLPDCALLAIKWHLENGKPFWHWTVFVREGEEIYVLDPQKKLKSNKRTDFGRMKPKWFIEVMF